MTVLVLIIGALVIYGVQMWTLRNVCCCEMNLRCSSHLVEPNESFELIITIKNKTRHFVPFLRYHISLPKGIRTKEESGSYQSSTFKNYIIDHTTWLQPAQILEVHIPVYCQARGRYQIQDVQLGYGDFLGLQEEIVHVGLVEEIVAYPSTCDAKPLKHIHSGLLGDLSAKRFLYDDPVLTLGYREYTGKEPMKNISWTQSAKENRLMVKNFDRTMEWNVSVCILMEKEEDMERLLQNVRMACMELEHKGIKYEFWMNVLSQGSFKRTVHVSEGLGNYHYSSILEHLGRASGSMVYDPLRLFQEIIRQTNGTRSFLVYTTGLSQKETIRQACMMQGCNVHFEEVRS